jgi:hypothetical protein
MSQVSRPLLAALVGVVLLGAVYLVALKPGGSTPASAPNAPGVKGLVNDVNKAKAVAGVNAAANARAGADATPTTAAPTTSTPIVTAPAPSSEHATTTTGRLSLNGAHDRVSRALGSGDVVAMLFYNPAATDDRMVRQELGAIGNPRGVVSLALPLSELTRYPVVTNQVAVTGSPTLVVIDGKRNASLLEGFADGYEISHLIADARAVGR